MKKIGKLVLHIILAVGLEAMWSQVRKLFKKNKSSTPTTMPTPDNTNNPNMPEMPLPPEPLLPKPGTILSGPGAQPKATSAVQSGAPVPRHPTAPTRPPAPALTNGHFDPFQKPENPDEPVSIGHLHALALAFRKEHSTVFNEIHNKPSPPTVQEVADEVSKRIRLADGMRLKELMIAIAASLFAIFFAVLYFTKKPVNFTDSQVAMIAEKMKAPQVQVNEANHAKLVAEALAPKVTFSDEQLKKIGESAPQRALDDTDFRRIISGINGDDKSPGLIKAIADAKAEIVTAVGNIPGISKEDKTAIANEFAEIVDAKVKTISGEVKAFSESIATNGVSMSSASEDRVGQRVWTVIMSGEGVIRTVNGKKYKAYLGPKGTSLEFGFVPVE
ncbi:MAG: hypothetical protein WC761_06080 [Candidatus Paceibacterota bacterium]|jgi:restriction endonuclease Mrr